MLSVCQLGLINCSLKMIMNHFLSVRSLWEEQHVLCVCLCLALRVISVCVCVFMRNGKEKQVNFHSDRPDHHVTLPSVFTEDGC